MLINQVTSKTTEAMHNQRSDLVSIAAFALTLFFIFQMKLIILFGLIGLGLANLDVAALDDQTVSIY